MLRASATTLLLSGMVMALPVLAQQAPALTPATRPQPDIQTESSNSPPVPQPDVQTASPGTQSAVELTRTDVEAWLDGFMPYALKRGDVAGAVVVVVKDGEVLLQKGYGYADVKERIPVDPARTLFRPGSVSKLFTWTAVMQQVERGKLDLDADINQYLDFEIPPGPNGEPITLRHLLTHTPGFEESLKELIFYDTGKLPPSLGAALKRWIPTRIYPAGTTPAYSNYGTALAGYVVERVSGLSFAEYVERNIFEPLGMTHSTFRQPLPEALQPHMSKGYELASGDPQPFELIPMAPAGSLSSSGADMAAFMIAHLQDGAYGDARILSQETAQTMHGTPLTILPSLNRMLLGFYETNINGRRVIAHGGDTQFFHSYLHLYVDDGVGLFVSLNSLGKDGAAGHIRTALFREFSDRYLPEPNPKPVVAAATAAEHAAMIAGTYLNSRRPETSLLSVLNLISPTKVAANPDGTIEVSLFHGLNDRPRKWQEVEPFVWTEVNGKSRLVAEVVDGRVTRFSVDDVSPFMLFERAPAAKSPFWLVPAVAASLAAILLTAVMWPVTAIVRRRYRQPFPLTGVEARAYRLVRIGATASALTVVAWGATVVAMLNDLTLLSSDFDWWLWTLHLLAIVLVPVGFAVALWNVGIVWRRRPGWFSKAWSVVLVLSTFVLVWLSVAFHLIGFSVNY